MPVLMGDVCGGGVCVPKDGKYSQWVIPIRRYTTTDLPIWGIPI